jgi:PKD repeat protein
MYTGIPGVVLLMFICTFFHPLSSQAREGDPLEQRVLARIDVAGNIEDLGIPIHADLVDSSGQEYLLTIAAPATLEHLKERVRILDPAAEGKRYLIALERRGGARRDASSKVKVLHDDGRRIVIRETPGVYQDLEPLGFDLKLLRDHPVTLPERREAVREFLPARAAYDPVINGILGQVSEAALSSHVSGLSGVTPVTVGGAPYTISARSTNSGVPVQKATQFAYEYFQGLGLTTIYQDWTGGSISNRNVIAELPGMVHPEEVVLVTAHIDDMPSGSVAPGADDNASGTAAVFVAADILRSYRFDRTIRFVLFTGEEQGLYGSWAYATSLSGQNVVAVINMDMISYNTAGSPPTLLLHTRPTNNPGYPADIAIGNVFIDVASTYSLPLEPSIKADGEEASDHSSFWAKGFPAILAIEDDYYDFTPYYHTTNDTLQTLNMPYFAAFAKAAIGTAAHLAGITWQLALQKEGTGTGSISPSSGTITWNGASGSARYPTNTRVDLTPLASADSVFSGWEGACSGSSNPCSLLFSSDLTVTALFSRMIDFTGSPTVGAAPLRVGFSDQSLHNPVSWSWSFGDGGTASSKNPAHIFRTSGNFTVSLNATGDGGTFATTKGDYVHVDPCGNLPVKIAESGSPYPSIQGGYNALSGGEHLRIQALDFTENLTLANVNAVSLQGGYDCGFSTILDYAVIHGSLTMGGGPVTIDGGIVIAP